MTGANLHIPLDDGRELWGFACSEHGLCHSSVGRPGDEWALEAFGQRGEQQAPVRGDIVACSVCGKRLAYAGLGGDQREVPDSCLDQLREVAEGLAKETET